MSQHALWYACVVELEVQRDGLIPSTHGQQLHGLFLDLVRSVDPPLAESLHAGSARRPFTLAPLQGLPRLGPDGHAVIAGTRLALRLSLLDSALLSGFLAALLAERAPAVVRLGALPLIVRRVATAPDQHPAAAMVVPARLLALAAPERAITLRFLSPTSFSLGNRPGAGKVVEPFPRPDLLFGGLLSAWNAFSDAPLDRSLRAVIAERVVVTRFNLRSAAYRFRDYVQIGAVGSCTYDIKGDLPDPTLRAINALADAAAYLGAGYRTTMGMGQARRAPPPNGRPE